MSHHVRPVSILNLIYEFSYRVMMDNYIDSSYDTLKTKLYTKIDSLNLSDDVKHKLKRGISIFIISLKEMNFDIQRRYTTIKKFFLNFVRKMIMLSYVSELNELYNNSNANREEIINLVNGFICNLDFILNGCFTVSNEKEFEEIIRRVYNYSSRGAISALILRTIASLQNSRLKSTWFEYPILMTSVIKRFVSHAATIYFDKERDTVEKLLNPYLMGDAVTYLTRYKRLFEALNKPFKRYFGTSFPVTVSIRYPWKKAKVLVTLFPRIEVINEKDDKILGYLSLSDPVIDEIINPNPLLINVLSILFNIEGSKGKDKGFLISSDYSSIIPISKKYWEYYRLNANQEDFISNLERLNIRLGMIVGKLKRKYVGNTICMDTSTSFKNELIRTIENYFSERIQKALEYVVYLHYWSKGSRSIVLKRYENSLLSLLKILRNELDDVSSPEIRDFIMLNIKAVEFKIKEIIRLYEEILRMLNEFKGNNKLSIEVLNEKINTLITLLFGIDPSSFYILSPSNNKAFFNALINLFYISMTERVYQMIPEKADILLKK